MPIGYGLPEVGQRWTCGSKHTGIVNLALCAGSVRTIRKGTTHDPGSDPNGGTTQAPPSAAAQALFNASGMRDGSIMDFSPLGQ